MLRDVRLVTHCCANDKQSKKIELHYLVDIIRKMRLSCQAKITIRHGEIREKLKTRKYL